MFDSRQVHTKSAVFTALFSSLRCILSRVSVWMQKDTLLSFHILGKKRGPAFSGLRSYVTRKGHKTRACVTRYGKIVFDSIF